MSSLYLLVFIRHSNPQTKSSLLSLYSSSRVLWELNESVIITFPCPLHPNWRGLSRWPLLLATSHKPKLITVHTTPSLLNPYILIALPLLKATCTLPVVWTSSKRSPPHDICVYVHVGSLLFKARGVCCVSLASLLPRIKGKKMHHSLYSAYTDAHTSKQRC